MKSSGETEFTVTGDITNEDIYATASVKKFVVSWNNSTGCNIAVKRTSSPYQGAAAGALSNGATIYYGDTLSVTYSAQANYNLLSSGMTSITVTGNVDKSKIYATAELLGVWYKNINGTDTQAKRIKYNLDFYYIGKDLHIKGYVYDTTNASSAKRIDVDSQHVKDTHTSDKNCPCGRGSGCNHGIDWIISGWYNGGIPAIHTWSSGYPDPIRLR